MESKQNNPIQPPNGKGEKQCLYEFLVFFYKDEKLFSVGVYRGEIKKEVTIKIEEYAKIIKCDEYEFIKTNFITQKGEKEYECRNL